MPISTLFGKPREAEPAARLYAAIVARARTPEFYEARGVPDSVDGRFELLTLHAFLVLRRLKGGDDEAAAVARRLVDMLVDDLDVNLREMGAGDMGVGKRVKAMVQAFYGRIVSYEGGLAGDGAALAEALRRNLYGTTEPAADQVAEMAAYVRAQWAALSAIPVADLLGSAPAFGAAVR